MPRRKKLTITVEPYRKLQRDRPYPVEVLELKESAEPAALLVKFRNLDPEQLGRLHEVRLPVPAYPQSPGAEYLRACRVDVDIGKIEVEVTLGAVLDVTFGPGRNDEDEIVRFAAHVSKENSIGRQPEPLDQSAAVVPAHAAE
jgi:hypothetical protein